MGLVGWHQEVAHLSSLDWILLVVFQPIRNGTIGFCTWLVNLSVLGSSDLEGSGLDEVDACVWLCWMELDGVNTWLSTFFPNLNVWTTLHWFNYWSSAKWACWEFLGFITGWLGKVPFILSFFELANWLIRTSSLCIVCMRESWFFMYLFMFFSKSVILL